MYGLRSMTCTAPVLAAVIVAGHSGFRRWSTLIEHFYGTSRQVVPSPKATTHNGLNGIARAGGQLWATGASFPASWANGQTLAETYP